MLLITKYVNQVINTIVNNHEHVWGFLKKCRTISVFVDAKTIYNVTI